MAAETLFRAIAPRFKRELPQPVITIQPQGRHNACAWFWADRWQNRDLGLVPEINLCAEFIADGLLDLANSVFHETVHYSNWLDGVRDCSASQYHNLHFKRRCESIGLICEPIREQRRLGWARTSLSAELATLVQSLEIDEESLNLHRIVPTAQKRPGSKLKKWSCRCTNVWAAVEVDATCNRCGGLLRRKPAL